MALSLPAARVEALSTGKTVPVGALTTEVSTTEALPDGTFGNTTSARVYKDGVRTPVDTTPTADGHGGCTPKANPRLQQLTLAVDAHDLTPATTDSDTSRR
ncbi:hypothetical protein ACL07V_35105 [Streptomyces sp. MB22_4]|uniref:hypothetical protein n=1 Tax=Streptomyces sp. MB22_4 TaxID=3383120 RepID=UPI0039A0A3B3